MKEKREKRRGEKSNKKVEEKGNGGERKGERERKKRRERGKREEKKRVVMFLNQSCWISIVSPASSFTFHVSSNLCN